MRLFLLMLAILSVGCAWRATRDEAIATAYRYTQVEWTPEARHVRHGNDSNGIPVRTPDLSTKWHGDKRG